jgi:hypothetical protein
LADFVVKEKVDKAKDQIPYGTLFVEPAPPDDLINHLAWKDNCLVLFQSTVNTSKETIMRNRKRPSETPTSHKTAKAVFDSKPSKDLDIPVFVDKYNDKMAEVDKGDKLMAGNPSL